MLANTLNHAYETRVVGLCDVLDVNNYSFCTAQVSSNFQNWDTSATNMYSEHCFLSQTNATNECLTRWSGALVCPDDSGTFYAVGIYYAHQANCGLNTERAPNK